MDIEDVYGDTVKLNALLLDFTEFFKKLAVPCDVYISGIRLDSLSPDILSYMNCEKYIKLGYHSNTHSFMTIPMMNDMNSISFAEEHCFDLQKKDFNPHSPGGIIKFRQLSDSPIFRCPNFAWTPSYFKYMKQFGMKYTNIDINYHKPFSFMGITILPVVEKPLETFKEFSEVKEQIERYQAVSIYLHPSRLIYDQFWDKSKQRNVYDNISQRVELVKQLILSVQNEYKTINLHEIDNYYNSDDVLPNNYEAENLILKSMTKKWTWSQLPLNYYSQNHIDDCITVMRGLSLNN